MGWSPRRSHPAPLIVYPARHEDRSAIRGRVDKVFLLTVTLSMLVILMACDPARSVKSPRERPPTANRAAEPPVIEVISAVDLAKPEEPAIGRIVETKVQLFPQVYLDSTSKVYHQRGCASLTDRMPRAPASVARMQSYKPDSNCASIQPEPEYTVTRSVHPEWVAYERALDRYQAQTAAAARGSEVQTPDVTRSLGAVHSSRQVSAPTQGEVRVKGYYKKDGTYVRPHTRKRAKD